MATNTPIPRRCIVRAAVSKFAFVAAVAIATSSALAFSGALNAGSELAQATRSAGTQAVSGQSYGYPLKPFDQEHLIRANLGDPRMHFVGPPTLNTVLQGDVSVQFHKGVDIAATPGTAVYPVVDGTVTQVTPRLRNGRTSIAVFVFQPAYQVSGWPSPSSSRKLYACQVCVGMTTATRCSPSRRGRRTNGAYPTRPPLAVRRAKYSPLGQLPIRTGTVRRGHTFPSRLGGDTLEPSMTSLAVILFASVPARKNCSVTPFALETKTRRAFEPGP